MGGNVGRTTGHIIADTLDLSGTGAFTITGLGLPPPTTPLYVHLVQ